MIIGFIMWWAVLKSGVHATIAGVTLGFIIPASRGWSVEKLKGYAQEGFELFRQAQDENLPVSKEQAVHHMNQTVNHAASPLHRLERSEEHTAELHSRGQHVCRLLLDNTKNDA